MPSYNFQCTECDYCYTRLKRMAMAGKDDVCPLCSSPAKFVYSAPGWVRGPQWHARMTDHDAGKPGRKG